MNLDKAYLETAHEVVLLEDVGLLQLLAHASLVVEQHVQFEHVVLHVADAALNLSCVGTLPVDLSCNYVEKFFSDHLHLDCVCGISYYSFFINPKL